jgi:pimeloyl-ACP methyl ester carboxylesterase
MVSKTIIFIHGMYMNPLCWEHWILDFQAKGYQCLAPAWLGRDKSVTELQNNPTDPELGKLNLSMVIEQYTKLIQALPEKPIVIGHSMGGLVAQVLLQRELVAAAIAIDSAAPSGVFTTQFSFLKANWEHINPFAPQGQPIVMTFERFQYAFVNTMPLEEQRAAFERYVVPESRRVPAESLFMKIDFHKPGTPLLMIAGAIDNLIPAGLNKINFSRYKRNNSITTFKEFDGRNHFILGQKNWKEVADYISSWIKEVNA